MYGDRFTLKAVELKVVVIHKIFGHSENNEELIINDNEELIIKESTDLSPKQEKYSIHTHIHTHTQAATIKERELIFIHTPYSCV